MCEEEDVLFKSCFARSLAVNSQYKQQTTKSSAADNQQVQNQGQPKISDHLGTSVKSSCAMNGQHPCIPEMSTSASQQVMLRKDRCCIDRRRAAISSNPFSDSRSGFRDTRRFSCSHINSARNPVQRISEIPVENIVNQSKIETLQWQIKEIQKSREMYKAVMKQVITYLDKTHHSLELLGTRMKRKNSVHRSKSEHQIVAENCQTPDASITSHGSSGNFDDFSFKDFTWQQNKPEEPSAEEIPPEKLSQEAFRLLRTAQSLLNTQEPDLCQVEPQIENDVEFLAQLAREFPNPELRPQRATSFSLSPKLILPENEAKLSAAFNRKLSLQPGDVRRYSKNMHHKGTDSARGSVAGSDTEEKGKGEKRTAGSVSSVEDESGFSSMNSFQEVGLPVINSTMTDEVSTKKALLRSMLQNNGESSLTMLQENSSQTASSTLLPNTPSNERHDSKRSYDDIKLWQKPSSNSTSMPQHKRWFSSPSQDAASDSPTVKVLWV